MHGIIFNSMCIHYANNNKFVKSSFYVYLGSYLYA
jgi:hypothetical protein